MLLGGFMPEEDITKVVKSSKRGATKGERRGGREKGTPNRKTVEFLEALGDFDTVQEAKHLFNTTDDDGIKYNILKEFLKYEFPQRKAVEIANDIELPSLNIKGL